MALVHFDNGPSFDCADGDTLLRGALRAGIGFPHECNVGGCGGCKFELLSGEVRTLWDTPPGLTERDRRRGSRLACQSVPRGEVRVRTRLADEHRPVHRPALRPARLRSVDAVTHDIAAFTFQAEAPATFRPGQYALLSLPGVEGVRAYSMSNLPNADGLWQFMVRRVPGGRGSAVLFDRLQPGDAVGLDGPYGHAWLRQPLVRDVLCLAGGSGLAPMLSIARAAAPQLQAAGRTLHFCYGGRAEADLLDPALFASLAGFGRHLRLQQVLSQPAGPLPPGVQQGFVHAIAEQALGDTLAAHEVYFAGPPAMAEAVQDLLMVRHRVPFAQVHFDRFC